MEFLLADNNFPFSVALMLMLIIALTEGVLTVIGAGMSEAIDSLLPDIEFDIDGNISSGGVLTSFLGWIRFGQVPALVLLVIFLATFGLAGLVFQSVLESILGFTLPALIASPLAVVAALPMVRGCNGVLAKVAFKDETESISASTFSASALPRFFSGVSSIVRASSGLPNISINSSGTLAMPSFFST